MAYPTTIDDDGQSRIVIIGAGIGGLTLGAILRKLGVPFVILERTAEVTPVGAGISLAPNCLRALEQLGLLDTIWQESQELRKVRITRVREGKPEEWKELNFGLSERWFGYNVRSIERHRFHGLLYEAAGVENVRLDCAVDDVVDDPMKSFVVVKLRNGEGIHGRMAVGADGIRSVTRRVLARNDGNKEANTIRFTGRVHMSGYTAPLEHLSKDDLGVGHWILYDDRLLTTWPCVDNRQWFIGVKQAVKSDDPDRSVWRGATKDTVNDVYGERYHPFGEDHTVRSIVNKSERVIASNVFEEVAFSGMCRGRVALLGDAAHSMTSFFGQGACQAIEDAVELANAITGMPGPHDSAKLPERLQAYSLIRMKRGQEVSSFSGAYARLHTGTYLPGWFGQRIRYLVYNWFPSSGWMWYLKWLYGYQPTVRALA